MTRWKITIEYNGAPYAGSQKQPDIATVQGEIENALYKFCQQKIDIIMAGRTDAGVHARAQIAHFDLDYRMQNGNPRPLSAFELIKAINAHLTPQPIAIIDAVEVGHDFHARFEAKQKHYIYRIVNRPHNLAIDQGYAWWAKHPLDIETMNKAAQYLIGEHDFSSFRDSECQAKSPIRSIDELYIEATPIINGQEVFIHAKGMAFLHHMVRNIVGSLVYVGTGKWQVENMQAILNARDRTKAGPTAPAGGLYLQSIDYV